LSATFKESGRKFTHPHSWRYYAFNTYFICALGIHHFIG
jgi:hypothetical protein